MKGKISVIKPSGGLRVVFGNLRQSSEIFGSSSEGFRQSSEIIGSIPGNFGVLGGLSRIFGVILP